MPKSYPMPTQRQLSLWSAHMCHVCTIDGVANMFGGLDRKTVMVQIDRGRLLAQKVGGVWLVSVDSAAALWGMPKASPWGDAISPVMTQQWLNEYVQYLDRDLPAQNQPDTLPEWEIDE